MSADTKQVPDTGKRKPPAAGKGRPKGAINKVTRAAKDVIAMAAEKLGGTDRIVAWAQKDPKNESIFWSTIYPRLIPVQMTGEDGGPIKYEKITREFVRPSAPPAFAPAVHEVFHGTGAQ